MGDVKRGEDVGAGTKPQLLLSGKSEQKEGEKNQGGLKCYRGGGN